MTSVLISGASIAGMTLAYWLRRHNITVVIVETAPHLRLGGQAIDVRGTAMTVLRKMGLESAANEKQTTMQGMSMVDGHGNEQWRSEEMTLSAGRVDSDDLELLREDLVQIIYSATEGVEYRFDDSIIAVEPDETGVSVQFERSESRQFDLVVGADGLHSVTRDLVFGPEEAFITHLGTYLSIFSCDNFLGLHDWQTWFNEGNVGGAVFAVRNNTELRVNLGFMAEPFDFNHQDTPAHKQMLEEKFTGLGWKVPQLLDRMRRSDDFYFDSMAQIHMPSWTQGRVALIGDAAHCASPLSGQGSSIAMVGAFVLASELHRADGDHQGAFERYEKRMRPFAESNQALATDERDRHSETENVAAVDKVKNDIDLSDLLN